MSKDEFAEFWTFIRTQNGFDDIPKAHDIWECQKGLFGVLIAESKHLKFMATNGHVTDFLMSTKR